MNGSDVKIDEIGKTSAACEENLKAVQDLSEHIESLYEKLLPVRCNLPDDMGKVEEKTPTNSKSTVRAMIEVSNRKIGEAIAFLDKIYEEVEV